MRRAGNQTNHTALKLAALIIAGAAVSAEILASRAQRLRAAHAATAALEEARAIERTIEHARADIARLSSPERVRAIIEHENRDMIPLLAASDER